MDKGTNTMTELLRQAMNEPGAPSLTSIAEATGTQRGSLVRFRRGDTSLRLDLADRLADYFGVECTMRRSLMPKDEADLPYFDAIHEAGHVAGCLWGSLPLYEVTIDRQLLAEWKPPYDVDGGTRGLPYDAEAALEEAENHRRNTTDYRLEADNLDDDLAKDMRRALRTEKAKLRQRVKASIQAYMAGYFATKVLWGDHVPELNIDLAYASGASDDLDKAFDLGNAYFKRTTFERMLPGLVGDTWKNVNRHYGFILAVANALIERGTLVKKEIKTMWAEHTPEEPARRVRRRKG
jgi:transcriptional regulator with XRE-family HTH domain